MEKVKITYGDETVVMQWNGTQASAPILVDGEATPFQTATARHRTNYAVALVCRLVWPDSDWPTIPSSGPVPIDWQRDSEAWDLVHWTVE